MRQSLSFKLIRSGQLTPEQLGVMAYVWSYSDICAGVCLQIMAREMMTTERTLRRIINKLVQKGVLIKRYGPYKRLRLHLPTLEVQESLIGPGMLLKAIERTDRTKRAGHVDNSTDRTNKAHHDRPNTTGCDRPPVSESIQNKTNRTKYPSEINSGSLEDGNGDGERLVKGEDWLKALRSTVVR